MPADVDRAREDFGDMAAVLDRHMTGRRFALGDTVTVADFVLGHTLDWANEIRLLDRFPLLQAYVERMYARPHAPPRIAAALASIRQ
ncbi:MAG TPA: glutathione S-transferase C-terminal domain-containing protein [Stellaceae bacterium]|nr:glutathione S-transferase C-terminal domain-containing protein [Stellaceae bacterium]